MLFFESDVAISFLHQRPPIDTIHLLITRVSKPKEIPKFSCTQFLPVQNHGVVQPKQCMLRKFGGERVQIYTIGEVNQISWSLRGTSTAIIDPDFHSTVFLECSRGEDLLMRMAIDCNHSVTMSIAFAAWRLTSFKHLSYLYEQRYKKLYQLSTRMHSERRTIFTYDSYYCQQLATYTEFKSARANERLLENAKRFLSCNTVTFRNYDSAFVSCQERFCWEANGGQDLG